MTIDDLCAATGIGRNSYYNKIRGDRCFNTEEIDAIARVLGCDPLLILEEASAKAQIESDAQLAKKAFARTLAGERFVDDEQARIDETLKKLHRGDMDIVALEDEHKYDGDGDEPA